LRHYGDPQGLFRVEIPASWRVQQTEGTFTHGQQGRFWEGERTLTSLHAPTSRGEEERRLWVWISIERYAETPPPVLRGSADPTDVESLRRYRLSQDVDWRTCAVGHLRVHIQYEIQGLSPAYHPAGWEAPAPLSPDERQERLLVVQRIIDSFELLATS
jgi:hypothetical protein